MSWEVYIKGYYNYLLIEKSLSKNTVEAYERDIRKMAGFFLDKNEKIKITSIKYEDFQDYLAHLNEEKIKARSQSRIISSIRSF